VLRTDCGSRGRAHDQGIAAIDEAIGVHIGTEVGRIGRLTSSTACLQGIAGINKAIVVGIAAKKTHGHCGIGKSTPKSVVDTDQSNPDVMRVADDAGQVHDVSARVAGIDQSTAHRAAAHGRLVDGGERIGEGEDDREVVARAAAARLGGGVR